MKVGLPSPKYLRAVIIKNSCPIPLKIKTQHKSNEGCENVLAPTATERYERTFQQGTASLVDPIILLEVMNNEEVVVLRIEDSEVKGIEIR